jgi:hypothetical protein
MKNTERLTFLNNKSTEELNQLWENTFAGKENDKHIHEHVPPQFAVPEKDALLGFARNINILRLIKRIQAWSNHQKPSPSFSQEKLLD